MLLSTVSRPLDVPLILRLLDSYCMTLYFREHFISTKLCKSLVHTISSGIIRGNVQGTVFCMTLQRKCLVSLIFLVIIHPFPKNSVGS